MDPQRPERLRWIQSGDTPKISDKNIRGNGTSGKWKNKRVENTDREGDRKQNLDSNDADNQEK